MNKSKKIDPAYNAYRMSGLKELARFLIFMALAVGCTVSSLIVYIWIAARSM